MPLQLDVGLLRSFATVAQVGALGRAAERVGRSQAAVSMQMQRLEGLVGQTLLLRTGRGVSLTLHGERLLAHAVRILRAHDEAVAELSGRMLNGALRFGCPDDYASAFMPGLLRGFARLHPQVTIDVVCASTPRLFDLLDARKLDIALTSVPLDGAAHDVLRREALVWVGLKGGEPGRPEPLRLALGDPDTLDHGFARAALDEVGRAYRVAYASGSLSGLLAVVRSGQAVAVLTEAAVPRDLQILSPERSGLPALPRVGLVIRTDFEHASASTRAFASHLRSELPTLPREHG